MIERKLLPAILKRLKTKEAIVVTGMRRVGKTTLLKQIYDRIESSNKLFLDLENPLNQKYFDEKDYEAIANNLRGLGVALNKNSFVFLDEIQFLKNIPSVIKYLSDHYPIKFFLTGSASFYLKNLFSESLAGRKYLFELYPLDFEEFLMMKGKERVPSTAAISESLHTHFETLYREYVEFGGFPGVIAKGSAEEKREALNDIFSSYFNKEILQLGDFRNNQIIRDLMLLLLGRIGSRIEIQKLSAELGVSRITIKEYLAFLEGTYFIDLIKPFSRNRDIEIRSTPKLYCIDSGLAYQIGKIDFGHAFENAIFHQFKSRTKDIRYYQKKTGVEIDFIIDKKEAYEVKLFPSAPDAALLKRVAKELNLKISAVISYKFSKLPKVIYGFKI